MRAKDTGAGGELTIRTGAFTRSIDHLSRLLSESLAKTTLLAPVGELTLAAVDVMPLEEISDSLLPGTVRQGETLREVLERISARLGPERVVRPVMREDHRIEWAQFWQPAADKLPRETSTIDSPQPIWLLPEPLRLAVKQHRPMYQGTLQLLAGPHRVEGGWWHRLEDAEGDVAMQVARDYWVALSQHAGVLWVFQVRLADGDEAWFLHGMFA